MILPKEKYLAEVKIEPAPDKWQINGAALDLRVGRKLYFPETGEYIDVQPGNKIVISPRSHFLIQTLEKVTLPADIVGVVYPRSGTNRKGITVDMTGIVDPGYSGNLMVPVSNLMDTAVEFYAGERIAQIMFERMEHVTEVRESKYHGGEIHAKPDKEEELQMLKDGSLFATKTALLDGLIQVENVTK
jgi:deoxycytidine triphosphate deaminase